MITSPTSHKVAIIGGGMSGLGVAYELLEKGYQVTVFEKADQLGGLAVSMMLDGTPIENFYHHMFPTYKDFFEVADRIGVRDSIYFVPATTSIYFEGKIYPFSSALDLLRFSPLSLFDRVRAGVVTLYLKSIKDWKRFEYVSASAWLTKHFGVKAYQILWAPLLESKFGAATNQVSMVWFWSRLFERPKTFGYFKGGFRGFVAAIEVYLKEKDVVVRPSTQISAITKKGNGFDVSFGDTHEQFDQVVVAAPPKVFSTIARDLLPVQELEIIKGYRYVGTVCGLLVLKKHLTPYYWINVNEGEHPFVAIVEQTNFVDENTYDGKHPVYLSRYVDSEDSFYKKSDEQVWSEFLSSLKQIVPSFDPSDILEKRLFRAPYTQPLVEVGYESKRPSFSTSVEGLYWVSMSHIYPWDRGTGHSFHAGRMVAQEIMKKV